MVQSSEHGLPSPGGFAAPDSPWAPAELVRRRSQRGPSPASMAERIEKPGLAHASLVSCPVSVQRFFLHAGPPRRANTPRATPSVPGRDGCSKRWESRGTDVPREPGFDRSSPSRSLRPSPPCRAGAPHAKTSVVEESRPNPALPPRGGLRVHYYSEMMRTRSRSHSVARRSRTCRPMTPWERCCPAPRP